jgi:ankyrin repeat protein
MFFMPTSLLLAAHCGDIVEMRRLVAAGADVEQQGDRGARPLHVAAGNGQAEAIKVLVQLGVNKEAKTAGGMTALHHQAAESGQVAVIKALIHLGADKEAKGADGGTALRSAVINGNVEVIKCLVQLGVNKEAKDADGDTPLHVAAAKGHTEVIKVLVQLGVNKEAKDWWNDVVAPRGRHGAPGGDQVSRAARFEQGGEER